MRMIFLVRNFLLFYPSFALFWSFLDDPDLLPERIQKKISNAITNMKCAIDLPITLILPTVFVVIAYFMGAVSFSAIHFLPSLATVYACCLTAQTIGALLGTLITDNRLAQVIFRGSSNIRESPLQG